MCKKQTKVLYATATDSFSIGEIRNSFGHSYLNAKIQEFLSQGEFRMGCGIIVRVDGIVCGQRHTINYDQLRLEIIEKGSWGSGNKSKFLRIGQKHKKYKKEIP